MNSGIVMSEILDLRLIGFYKIKQGILHQNLSKYNRFKSADTLSEHFIRFINTLKKERNKEKIERKKCKEISMLGSKQ